MSHAAVKRQRIVESAPLLRAPGEIECIGCGCTESRGCPPDLAGQSCAWVAVDEDRAVGLCSRCAALPIDELIERGAAL